MAHITEKRTSVKPHTLSATKENAKYAARSNGIEILDFHESWLEEVEIYKDKLLQSKQKNQQQQQQQQQPTNHSQHLAAHNRGRVSGRTSNVLNNADAKSPPAASKQMPKKQVSPKRRIVRERAGSNSPTKSERIALRGSPPKAAVVGTPQTEPNKKVQMLLKRSLDANHDKPATKSSKRSTNTPNSVKNEQQTESLKVSSNSTIKQNSNIVVTAFHGSSLLIAQPHDDKSKILTQNGLTKSAATALETSLYASLYSPPPQSAGHYSARLNSGEYTNYSGVSMNKPSDQERYRHEEDPCAAIDDVNSYDESESDEEYVGEPFFLDDEIEDCSQSKQIHCTDKKPSKESVATTDSVNSVYSKPDCILSPSLFPNVPPYLNFTSHVDRGPAMPPSLHRVLKWKLSPVMPKIVKRVVLNSGFRIIKNTTDWMAVWEKHMKSPGFRTIRSHQKYNHMPGSFRIGRKDTMWRSIYVHMKKFGKNEFGFMQKSYVMPDDLENLRRAWPKSASKLNKWIVKPPASARGTGIRIVNKWSQFPKDRPLVVQKYIERPLLINDNKFDMRLYVILTSINPLRIYMYKDGLARFAAVKYSSELNNLDERCMHLTNYSINKYSQNYTKNEDINACQGHKWTLQSLWSCLENRGVNTKRLWATLRNLVIRGIVSGESGLNRMYRQSVNFRYNCFELFGFDVLLDENIVPWLLEINISPSLHSELPLDLHVKGPLIQAVLNTALYQVPPKLNEQQQREILEELNLKGPLCIDKRLFTTCLTADEVRKHNQFTSRSVEFREEYIDTILDNLLPDDVRCLIIAEDELARCQPLERLFPTAGTHKYLRFFENSRYYNRLLDAWETKYGKDREKGIALLSGFCKDKYHLQVSDAALEKEPNVALTEIDMLHVKKEDDMDTPANGYNIANGNLQPRRPEVHTID